MASSSNNAINQGSPQYPYPCHVNATSFLSIKLSGETNYRRWKGQMMCLAESHDMLGFIDGTFKNPKKASNLFLMGHHRSAMELKYKEWKKSDRLVQGWILGSLTEDLMDPVIDLDTANDVWEKLRSTYTTTPLAPTGNKDYTRNQDALTLEVDEDNSSNGERTTTIQMDAYGHMATDMRAKDLYLIIIYGEWDLAVKLIQDHPEMKTVGISIYDPLKAIMSQHDAFFSGTRYNFYKKFVYSHVPEETENNNLGKFVSKLWKVAIRLVPHIKNLQEDKVKHNEALLVLRFICKLVKSDEAYEEVKQDITHAVELDFPEPIQEIYASYADARFIEHNGYSVTQLTIINRREKIYNSLMRSNHVVISDDEDGNSLLHMAGRLAPIEKLNLVSGAALQMQREFQWFQEIKRYLIKCQEIRKKERTFHGVDINTKNDDQETPIMVFRREHKELRKEGEEWMKKTADSYTITAALIITIVFAAAITVPGGNKGDTGDAIYETKPSFIIFAISDAISLFTSTTSLLLFLSILTARYRDEDFLYRLPKRLILGLATLFLSVTSMMVAFSATLYLMFGHDKAWILIPIAALTCLPIASFVTLQFPLLFELISSTYGTGIFPKEVHEEHHRRTRLVAFFRFISFGVMFMKSCAGDQEV